AITVGIFYFMIIRPQQKRQKETEAMLASVKKGDRVLTTGGIYGTVVGTKDDVVVLKVTDEVKMEFSRASIVQVKERGE
ncbi:MAG: preprotein translocase subunit YajC, partial [Candidatus Eisenbacteria bacterium]